MNKAVLTRTIWVVSLVSLFTDIASEMLYPILPLYLKSIGFSVAAIGILEGVAEATAGLSKGYFGKLSDSTARRLPFVRIGYLLSALSKPMMALFTFPLWVFSARTLDRLGKGIRTGARDALLSAETTAQHKGKVFGFHRSMDTLGAVAGPLLALVYLYWYPQDYRRLFFLAFIPGLVSVLLTFILKERPTVRQKTASRVHFLSSLAYVTQSPVAYRRLLAGLLGFALINSSDVFLLLAIKQSGLSDYAVVQIYIFYNLIYALFAYPVGILSDRIGLWTTYLAGLALFCLVYAGMAFSPSMLVFYGLFFLYGLYAASSESIAKALISNISAPEDTATAIGTYSGLSSISTLLASSLAGFLWIRFSPGTMFMVSAVGGLLVLLYAAFVVTPYLRRQG